MTGGTRAWGLLNKSGLDYYIYAANIEIKFIKDIILCIVVLGRQLYFIAQCSTPC